VTAPFSAAKDAETIIVIAPTRPATIRWRATFIKNAVSAAPS